MLPTVPTHFLIARKKIAAADSREHAAAYTCSCDDIFSSPTYAGPSKFVFLADRAGKAGVPGSARGARITRRHTHAHTCCSLCLLGRTGHRRQWACKTARKTTALCRVHKRSVPPPQRPELTSATEKAPRGVGTLETPAPTAATQRKEGNAREHLYAEFHLHVYIHAQEKQRGSREQMPQHCKGKPTRLLAKRVYIASKIYVHHTSNGEQEPLCPLCP